MSNRSDFDEVTPPRQPAGLRVLREAAEGAAKAHSRIDSLEEAVGRVEWAIGESEERVKRRIDALEHAMHAGFERIGELIDDVHREHTRDTRRAETSHHDLSEELARTKRIAIMKSISLPTAIVVGVVVVCYTVLLALHVEVPTWMGAIIASVGSAVAGMLPALLGQGKAS